VLVQSFEGGIPKAVLNVRHDKVKVFGNIKLFQGHRKPFEFYGLVPLSLPQGQSGDLHVLFEKGAAHEHEGIFALGLLLIGIAVALLTYPVSRFITKRVKELRQSALQIADGDISHRTDVGGKDEIGELARSFNRMADQLERMIQGGKELTANVSHELRSPLARIRIAAELLRERLQKGNIKGWEQYFDDIHEDIEELDRLIGRILDLSKIDLHDSPLKAETFNFSELVVEILERYKPAIDQKALHLAREIDPDVPFWGDQEAMTSAISNILDNAVKFTPRDGRLIARLSCGEAGVRLSIVNTHHPLPEKDLNELFEPFKRSEGTQGKGTGLGLAITKRIIQKHGGRIQVRNIDEGFMIEIHFPLDSAGS
jgi:two-component system sensor histidine kinase CpxA